MSDENDSSDEQTREPTAKEGKSDEIFEVETILDHDITENKKVFFKVRWAGYDSSEDTWEPEEDLQECAKKVIKQYYKKQGVHNKAELVKKEAKKTPNKKKKITPSKPAKRERSPSPVSEEEESDADSDASDGSEKAPSKNKKRRSNKPSTSSTSKPKVQTKAAVKSYNDSSPTKASAKSPAVTSIPKQKAQGVRQMMWDSSDEDDEDERPDISEIDKIASKVKPNTAPISAKTGTSSAKTDVPIPSPAKIELPVSSEESLPSTSAARKEEWTIDGIARAQGSNGKLILVTNSASGDRQVLYAEDAFKLCGWALTKYMLDLCEF